MRRIEDVIGEVRHAIGEPATGPSDAAFLASLATERRRRSDLARTFTAGLAFSLLLALVLVFPIRTPSRPADVSATVAVVPPLRVDPVAAMLLESARLRLEGFGDPEVARLRLVGVIEEYAGTESAREAGLLLAKLEGRE